MRDYKDTLNLPFGNPVVEISGLKVGDEAICIDASPVKGLAKGSLDITEGRVYKVIEAGCNPDRWVGVEHDAGDIGVYRRDRFKKA